MAKPLNYLIFNQGSLNNLETPGMFNEQRVVMPMAGEIVEVWGNSRNADVDIATTLNVWINNADTGIDLTKPTQTNPSSTPIPLTSDGRIFVNFGDQVRLESNGECNNANTDTEFTLVLKARERFDRSIFYLVGDTNLALNVDFQGFNEERRVIPVRAELYGAIMNANKTLGTGGINHTCEIHKNGVDTGVLLMYRHGQLLNTGALGEMSGRVFFEAGEDIRVKSNGEQAAVATVAWFTYCFRRA